MEQNLVNASPAPPALLIPLNSLTILSAWFPDWRITEITAGGSKADLTSNAPLKIGNKFIGLSRVRTNERIEIKYPSHGRGIVDNAISWSELKDALKDTGVSEVSVSKITLALEDEVVNYPLLLPTFSILNFHENIFRKTVADGVVPSQSIISFYKKVRAELKKQAVLSEKNKKFLSALNKTRGSMLILTELPGHREDAELIFALAKPPKLQYVEGKLSAWVLQELGHQRKGGVKGRTENYWGGKK